MSPSEVSETLVRGAVIRADVEGDGGPILFIHGLPLDRTMWRHQVAGLKGWARIAPDLRGFGLSETPPAGWTLADHADDLAALLDERGLGSDGAVVCGLSMGGYIAFELLRRHPHKVRALILANTRAEPDSAEGREQRDKTIQSVRERGTSALVEAMLPKLLSNRTAETQPEVVAQVRSMIQGTSAEGAIAAIAGIRDRKDSTELLKTIRIPTLVVAGQDDAIIPLDVQRGLGQIPGSTVEIVPGAGHMTPLEQPEIFNRAVSRFLGTVR